MMCIYFYIIMVFVIMVFNILIMYQIYKDRKNYSSCKHKKIFMLCIGLTLIFIILNIALVIDMIISNKINTIKYVFKVTIAIMACLSAISTLLYRQKRV